MNTEKIASAIREVSKIKHPLDSNVAICWPRISLCMDALGQTSRLVKMAAIGTTAVETAWKFLPIHEYGSEKYLNDHYDTRTDLGNTPEKDGDGALYCGRGFIQITGKVNYLHYGKLLGIDLVASPDKAMETDTAAAILAAFFRERNISVAAEAGDWKRVRKIINGGTNGLEDFLNVISELQKLEEGDII